MLSKLKNCGLFSHKTNHVDAWRGLYESLNQGYPEFGFSTPHLSNSGYPCFWPSCNPRLVEEGCMQRGEGVSVIRARPKITHSMHRALIPVIPIFVSYSFFLVLLSSLRPHRLICAFLILPK